MPGYGFAGHIGIAPEASGGVPVAATDYFYALSESLTADRARFDTVNIAGRYNEMDDQLGLAAVGGDIVAAAHPVSFGWFLAGISAPGSISPAGSMFAHSWKPRTNDWDARFPGRPFTFEIGRDVGSSQRYSGVVFSRLEMQISANGALQATAGLIGLSDAQIAGTVPTYPGSPTEHFAFDACSLSIDGAANVEFEGFTITIDQQLQGIATLAARNTHSKIRRTGPVMVRCGGTIGFENISELEAFRLQTERKFQITFTEAASHALTLIMPRVVYSAFPIGTGGRDRRTVSWEGIARFHTGSALALEAILTTTKSFYAV